MAVNARWGAPEHDPTLRSDRFTIAGLRLGHVFVGIQPAHFKASDPPLGQPAAVRLDGTALSITGHERSSCPGYIAG